MDARHALVVGAVVVAACSQAAPASAYNCRYDAATRSVVWTPQGHHAAEFGFVIDVEEGVITASKNGCGGATVENTSRITIRTRGDLTIRVDGITAFTSHDENGYPLRTIRFRIDMPGASLYLAGIQNAFVGEGGIALDHDARVDLAFLSKPPKLYLRTGPNANAIVSGQGGHGTGAPTHLPLHVDTGYSGWIGGQHHSLHATLFGGEGDDEIVGSQENDVIRGYGGDDVLSGLNIRGRAVGGLRDADVIDGGAGDDRIDGGRGPDTLIGGPGRDHVIGGYGADAIFVHDGERDVVEAGPAGPEGDSADADPGVDALAGVEHTG